MSKASGVEKTISKLITYVLVVLLLLGAAGVISYYVLKDEGVSFYVEYNGERYFSSVNEADLSFKTDDTYTFNVKSLTGENVDYSVSVLSNGEHNFTFICNGEFYDFYVVDNAENNVYSNVFSLQKSADKFSITLPKDFSVEQAIEAKFGGDVELQSELQSVSYFVIVVSAGNDMLNLFFSFGGNVTGVTVNPPSIVF
mgnify:CR=1 FL=1